MAQILKFEQNEDFYVRMYKKYLNEKNYFESLRYLKIIIEKNDSPEYKLLLGNLYCQLGDVDLSNEVYHRLIARKQYIEKAYLGIIKNCLNSNNVELFSYYFHKYSQIDPEEEMLKNDRFFDNFSFIPVESDDFEFDDLEEFDEEDLRETIKSITEKKPIFKLVSNEIQLDYDEIYKEATYYLNRDNPEAAINLILKSQPEKDKSFRLYNFLSLCYCLIDEKEKGAEISLKVLEESPDDLVALTSMLLYYNTVNDEANKQKTLHHLLSLDIHTISELYKISISFMEIGEYKYAADYLNKVLVKLPYDGDTYTLLAIAYNNLGYYNNALEVAHKAQQLRPHDFGIDELVLLIKQALYEQNATQINFQDIFPWEKTTGYVIRINELLEDDVALANAVFDGGENGHIIKWVFNLRKQKLQKKVVERLCALKNNKIDEFLLDMLLIQDDNYPFKRCIVENLLLNGLKAPFYIVLNERLCEINLKFLKIPENLKDVWFTCYCKCAGFFSALIDEFEDRFYKTFCDIYSKNKNLDLSQSVNTLSAIICYKCDFKISLYSKKNLVQFFNSSLKEFNALLKELIF